VHGGVANPLEIEVDLGDAEPDPGAINAPRAKISAN
jgi:hypothetical protein